VGLFGRTPDRGEMLDLQNRVSRLEEQVARLTAALSAQAAAAAVPSHGEPMPAPIPAPAPTQVATYTPMPGDDSFAEARALAAAGRKIHAIKAVREQSGMGLRQAKELVESW
jgi:ribosomal protein L7/L12